MSRIIYTTYYTDISKVCVFELYIGESKYYRSDVIIIWWLCRWHMGRGEFHETQFLLYHIDIINYNINYQSKIMMIQFKYVKTDIKIHLLNLCIYK